jgi:hypothetical protein
MDPVSNANRIAMLLRQRLQERGRAAAVGKSGRKDVGAAGDALGRSAVRGAAAVEALDDRKLRRVIVENILADQFGNGLVNEARFQQIVDQVAEAIEADDQGAQVLAQVVSDLRAKP